MIRFGNLKLIPLHSLWAQLHLRVNLVLTGFDESQARVQPLGWVCVDYLQLQNQAGCPAFLDQSADHFAANSLPPVFGKQRDIEKQACAVIALYDHTANWLMVLFNDLVLRSRIRCLNTIVVAH